MLAFPTTHLAKTMPSSAADNAIMTIGEVVDYLKVTERTIYRLAQYHGVLEAARRLHDEHLSVDPPNSFEMPSKQQVTHQG
jgi:hypothetical protein